MSPITVHFIFIYDTNSNVIAEHPMPLQEDLEKFYDV